MRRSAFKFRSTPFLGSSFPNIATVPFPQTSDPNMWLWYDSETWVQITGVNRVYTLGNKADYQVNKTHRTEVGNTNMVPYGGGIEPYLTRTDTKGNLLLQSQAMNAGSWSASSATINSATLVTFTAQNGIVQQATPEYFHEGKQLTLTFTARRVSGNTGLEARLESTYTAFTITDTLAEYSFNFTPSSAGATFNVGIRDPNAAGHGQIEITQWQLRISGGAAPWSSTYIQTTTDYEFPVTTASGRRALFLGPQTRFFYQYAIGTNGFDGPSFTIYMTYRASPHRFAGRFLLFSGSLYELLLAQESAVGQLRIYSNYPAPKDNYTSAGFVTDYQWYVLTFTGTYSGGCTFRKNLEAAVVGSQGIGTVAANQSLQWGAYSYDGAYAPHQCTELIWRYGIDSAATQEAYIRYLANRIGITV